MGEQQQFTFQMTSTATAVPRGDGSWVVTPGRPVAGPEVYTVAEVAERLKVDEQHVRDLIDEGEMAAVNIGNGKRKRWRVAREELERFKERRRNFGR